MKALSLETEDFAMKRCPAKQMSILAPVSSLMTLHVESFLHLPLGWR